MHASRLQYMTPKRPASPEHNLQLFLHVKVHRQDPVCGLARDGGLRSERRAWRRFEQVVGRPPEWPLMELAAPS